MSTHTGTALITGASSGIGAIYADRLARRGHDLILVARNRERLDALASRLRSETGRQVQVLVADLGHTPDIEKVAALLRSDARIDVLVNNAGVGSTATMQSADASKLEQMITLNVTALTLLTHAVVPGFVARRGGTIINIASVVAIAPELLNGVYGGSKAFVLGLTLSLHKELAEHDVRVQAVLPGATATEFWGLAGRPLEHLPSEIVMSAEDMVDASLSGLDAGELITIPALPDIADLQAYEQARQVLLPQLSRNTPAPRYRREG